MGDARGPTNSDAGHPRAGGAQRGAFSYSDSTRSLPGETHEHRHHIRRQPTPRAAPRPASRWSKPRSWQLGAGRAHRLAVPSFDGTFSAATWKAPPPSWKPTSTTRACWRWRATRRCASASKRAPAAAATSSTPARPTSATAARRRQRRVPGRARRSAAVRFAPGGPVGLRVELALGRVRPRQGHQHTHRHRAASRPQRQRRHPPGDEHHGAGAFMLAGTARERLQAVLKAADLRSPRAHN